MTINSLGIGSGILTSDLSDSLVEAFRAAGDLRIDREETELEAEITAYAELRGVMETLQSSVSSLATASTIESTSANSSDESVLTASTNSTAEPGSYRIEVDEIAKAHSLASKQYESVDDTVGTGTLTFKFGTTSYDTDGVYTGFEQNADIATGTLEITSENNTLGGIRDAVNDADFGVSASVVYDGTAYRLLLTSDDTGEATSMEITATGDAGIQSLAYNGAQNDESANMAQTQAGSDASVRVNGLAVTSTTNTLDQVIQGVTLNLTEASESGLTLTVSRDVDDIADNMDAFVAAYNDYKTIYDQLTEFSEAESDDEVNVAGILLGDSTLRTINSQIASNIRGMVEGLSGSTYSTLSELGITTDQNDDFNLVFDRAAFTTAMSADAQSVVGLLATDTDTTDAQVDVILVGRNTQPGTYDVNITQAATQAKYTGLSATALSFASDVVISDVNDEFSLTVDGNTATVSLEQGSYATGDDLALMLQSAINTSFSSASVSVTFDDDSDRFTLASSTFGSESEITMGSGDALIADTLGFAVAGSGEYAGSYFSTLSDASFAATTSAGTQAFAEDDSADFETNPVSFDLSLTGTTLDGTYAITLDENWADVVDTEGSITTDRNRDDVLTYVQSELNEAGLAGIVTAEFNSSDRLTFRTEPAAGTQTITIANTVTTGVDYLGINDGAASSGVSVSGASFDLAYNNRLGSVASAATINVPDGTYETAADLATAMATAVNADANIAAGSQGATTENGSRNLSSSIDFTTDPAQFEMALNGVDYSITVNSNGADNLDAIQTALDAQLGAGQVTASLSSNGLVLSTNATGTTQSIEVTSDGTGASSAAGSVDLSNGVDFSASPSTFTLQVDGVDIEVAVNGDGTADTNDAASNLSVIQDALDTALAAANGGGEFAVGDVIAKLDASNQVYFETQSKNGTQTDATFGADATIQITAVDANANSVLGVSSGAISTNGFDGFGLDNGVYTGFDSTVSVNYETDDDNKGRFVFSFGNDTDITLSNVSANASTALGLSGVNQVSTEENVGLDVEGTINGVQASGRGQYLTAAEGNNASTNGYLLGGAAADFSSAVTLDGTNNTLKVEIDGVESDTITLTAGAYTNGEALANELKDKINADSLLTAAGKSVDVQYDESTGVFGIFSVSKGSESTVSVSEITSGGIDILGFTTTTAGVDGEDTSGEVDDAAGLILKISGDRIGDRGSVSYIEGIMSTLDTLFDDMLGLGGILDTKDLALEALQEEIDTDRERLEERTTSYEDRLRSSFLYYDIVISQYQSTQDYLVQQFDAMNGNSDS